MYSLGQYRSLIIYSTDITNRELSNSRDGAISINSGDVDAGVQTGQLKYAFKTATRDRGDRLVWMTLR